MFFPHVFVYCCAMNNFVCVCSDAEYHIIALHGEGKGGVTCGT